MHDSASIVFVVVPTTDTSMTTSLNLCASRRLNVSHQLKLPEIRFGFGHNRRLCLLGHLEAQKFLCPGSNQDPQRSENVQEETW